MKKGNRSKISVTIAFKDANFIESLAACVKSFLNQTLPPSQIIIVGKKEDLDSLRKFLSKDQLKTVRIIFSDVGKNEARNIGIAAAKSDYVIFADHDMRAARNLLEKCAAAFFRCDALFIPEKGSGGNFWMKCRRLQKELVRYDLDTISPRFFKKNVFTSGKKPFDSKFGALDEWGFNLNLESKNVKTGIVDSYLVVKEKNLTLWQEVKRKYQRGLWLPHFYQVNSKEAWRRINPIKRGFIFYLRNIKYFFRTPTVFLGLLFFKAVSLLAFFAGAFVGLLFKNAGVDEKKDIRNYYNDTANSYVKNMYQETHWGRYVDSREKNTVKDVWELEEKVGTKNKKLLDLGMGSGRWSEFFLNYPFSKVVGLDLSPEMVRKAKNDIQDRRFSARVGDMEQIPFETGSFDYVFCFRAFKYLPNPKRALNEIVRVTSRGGSILLEVTNKNIQNMLLKLLSYLIFALKHREDLSSNWTYFRRANFYSASEIERAVRDCGAEVRSITPLFVIPSAKMPEVVDRLFFKLLVYFDNFFTIILPKKYFARSWLILFSKKKI